MNAHRIVTGTVLCGLLAVTAAAVPLHRDSLPNGLIVLTYEDHRLPAVSLRLVCRSGAAADPAGKAGTANLTAGLLLSGTSEMDGDSVAAALEFLGARQASNVNHDLSYVQIRTLRTHLDQVLDLLTTGITDPAFTESEFERERDQALTGARREQDNPGTVAMDECERLLFGDHPYGRRVWGDTLGLWQITPGDLREFHRLHYRPNNCFLVVVGDVERTDLLNRIRARLGDWKPAPIPEPTDPPVRFPEGLNVKLISRPDLTQTYVAMLHPGISINHPEMLATRLMSFVLGGSAIASRLGETVRVEGGLAYDIRCWFDRRARPGAFRATVQTVHPADAIRRMRTEFARMHDSGPTVEETDLARSYYTGSFPLGYASVGGKLYQVTIAERYRLGTDWLDVFPKRVKSLTRADLTRAAQTRLHPDDLLMVVIGNVTREDLVLPDAIWIE